MTAHCRRAGQAQGADTARRCIITAPNLPPCGSDRAEQYAPIIRELQRDGYSIRGIAVELDKRKMPTPAAAHGTRSSLSVSLSGSMREPVRQGRNSR
jgi:hypothetical protein